GPLFCVDDKPGIGVRTPTAPDQPAAPGRPARREFEYVRRGTVDLLAGFRVADGRVLGVGRRQHRSREVCALLDLLDPAAPPRPPPPPGPGPGRVPPPPPGCPGAAPPAPSGRSSSPSCRSTPPGSRSSRSGSRS